MSGAPLNRGGSRLSQTRRDIRGTPACRHGEAPLARPRWLMRATRSVPSVDLAEASVRMLVGWDDAPTHSHCKRPLMRVAVLGGGNGSFAAAGDLALAGHEVRLWRRDRAAVKAHCEAGGLIEVKDFAGRHEATAALVTN